MMPRFTWVQSLAAVVVFCAFAFPSDQKSSAPQNPVNVRNVQGVPTATKININNIASWYNANGEQERQPQYGSAGLWFPRGTANAVYSAGILWGGKFRDGVAPVIRVNGQIYANGTQPGAILGIQTGDAEDPNSPDVRIWRIRRGYATADLSEDVREMFSLLPGQVTLPWMIDSVKNQYSRDWREWPWHKGAPFYDTGYLTTGGMVVGVNNGVLDWGEDGNRDGILDGGEDANGNGVLDGETPGIANADQAIWYVCNDIGVAQPWASPTSGIEEQTTIWAYSGASALENIVFKRFRLIYKGLASTPDTARIDSMYVGQWSDVDLGAYTDDFVGCDTLLNLGYVYNANPTDYLYSQFGLVPPALGYDLVQGPNIRTGNLADTAIINFLKRIGSRNLKMSSFVYFATTQWPPPPFLGAVGFYQALRGIPVRGPLTGEPTLFWLNGDPVTGTGWIDGMLDPPGDRRFMMSSGPFTMALGDTQEFTVAVVGGLGADWLNSVTVMKSNAQTAKIVHDALFEILPPRFLIDNSYPSPGQVAVSIVADGRPAQAATIATTLVRQNGSVVAPVSLYDDGLHGDGMPNDGVFGNATTVSSELVGVNLEASTTDTRNRSFSWGRVAEKIPLVGEVGVTRFVLFSDNLNGDGKVNPGETIRFGLVTSNNSQQSLGGIRIRPVGEVHGKSRTLSSFAAGSSDSMVYNPSDPQSYFTLMLPQVIVDPFFRLHVVTSDTNHNRWIDTIKIPIVRWMYGLDTINIRREDGGVLGNFDILVVDPKALQKHLYVVRGVDTIASRNPRITVKDSTDGRILLLSHPLPDTFGYNVPVIDGFKLLRGTIAFDTVAGMKSYSWYWPAGGSVAWTSTRADGFQLEGFGGAIGMASVKWFSGSSVSIGRLKSVRIKFASTDIGGNPISPGDTLFSFGYRYLRRASSPPARPEFAPFIVNSGPGFAYQDFRKAVPFAAYDIESNPPRRLAVGFLENNVLNGLVDGKYWPPFFYPYFPPRNTDTTGAYEFFFIFDLPYSETPDPNLRRDIQNTTFPIMWWGTPGRGVTSFVAGGEFLIQAAHPFTPADVWTFQPRYEQIVPEQFMLSQNYPNPFNPNTTIEYGLPFDSRVTIRIYNILGQEVQILIDEIQGARNRRVEWDGTNTAGVPVASGLYFYRIEASRLSTPAQSFNQVKKMLLVR